MWTFLLLENLDRGHFLFFLMSAFDFEIPLVQSLKARQDKPETNSNQLLPHPSQKPLFSIPESCLNLIKSDNSLNIHVNGNSQSLLSGSIILCHRQEDYK